MVIPLKFKGESENTHSPYLSVSGTAARCNRSPYGFSPSLDILLKPGQLFRLPPLFRGLRPYFACCSRMTPEYPRPSPRF